MIAHDSAVFQWARESNPTSRVACHVCGDMSAHTQSGGALAVSSHCWQHERPRNLRLCGGDCILRLMGASPASTPAPAFAVSATCLAGSPPWCPRCIASTSSSVRSGCWRRTPPTPIAATTATPTALAVRMPLGVPRARRRARLSAVGRCFWLVGSNHIAHRDRTRTNAAVLALRRHPLCIVTLSPSMCTRRGLEPHQCGRPVAAVAECGVGRQGSMAVHRLSRRQATPSDEVRRSAKDRFGVSLRLADATQAAACRGSASV